MASGVLKVLHGVFTGTGAEKDITVVGFRPRKVELYNASALATAFWNEAMPDASAIEVADAGANKADVLYITSQGITPLSNGFRLGTDAKCNGSTNVVYWTASE